MVSRRWETRPRGYIFFATDGDLVNSVTKWDNVCYLLANPDMRLTSVCISFQCIIGASPEASGVPSRAAPNPPRRANRHRSALHLAYTTIFGTGLYAASVGTFQYPSNCLLLYPARTYVVDSLSFRAVVGGSQGKQPPALYIAGTYSLISNCMLSIQSIVSVTELRNFPGTSHTLPCFRG